MDYPLIMEKLDLPPGTPIETVRESAKAYRAKLHPDKSGGDFKDEAHKKEYLDVTAFIADTGTTDLAPRREKGLVEAVAGILEVIPEGKNPTSADLKRDCRDTFESNLASSYKSPRIGSAVFFGITGFFGAFAEQFNGDPVVGSFFTDPVTRLIMLVLAFYAGIFFVLTWYDEQTERAKVDWILSSTGVRNVFNEVMRATESDDFSFSKNTYADLVGRRLTESPETASQIAVHMLVAPFRGSMPQSAIDEVVDAHLSELQEKQAIQRISDGLLVPEYRVSEQMIERYRQQF